MTCSELHCRTQTRPFPAAIYLVPPLFLPPQNVYYTSSQQIHVGILSPTVDDDDNRCLVDVNSRPRLIECSYAKAKRMKLHWQFSQVLVPTPGEEWQQGGARERRRGTRLLTCHPSMYWGFCLHHLILALQETVMMVSLIACPVITKKTGKLLLREKSPLPQVT